MGRRRKRQSEQVAIDPSRKEWDIPNTPEWKGLSPLAIEIVQAACPLRCWYYFPVLPPCFSCLPQGGLFADEAA